MTGEYKNPDPRCTFPFGECSKGYCTEYAQFVRGEITREELDRFCVELVCKCWMPNREIIEREDEMAKTPQDLKESFENWQQEMRVKATKSGDFIRFIPNGNLPLIQEGIVGEVIQGSSGEVGFHVGLKDNGGIARIWPSKGKIERLKVTEFSATPESSKGTGEILSIHPSVHEVKVNQIVADIKEREIPKNPDLPVLDISSVFQNDIPVSTARGAFSWSSMEPEKRGDQARQEYADILAQDYVLLRASAKTPETLAVMEKEFDRYRAGYKARFLKWLHSMSRCASAFVTGGSNFPARQMEKRNQAEQARSEELRSFRERALQSIRKTLHPEERPVMAGDSDACERLRKKIADAEEFQEKVKEINKLVKKKGGPDLEGLRALGLSEEAIKAAIDGDCFGNKGVPSYKLTSNATNIRRMKGRLEQISKNQAKPDTSLEGMKARIEDCPAENRIRIIFPGKPSKEIRNKLHENGFRWTPSGEYWSAYRNPNSIKIAEEIAGIKEEGQVKS